MQGAGEHRERLLLLQGTEIGLRFDDGWPSDPHLLTGVLDTPRAEAWSGVAVRRGEPFDALHLWLATTLDGFGLLSIDRNLDTTLLAPQNRRACPAVADDASFAYLALRRTDDGVHEFGAHGFGPQAEALACQMAEQIRVWDRDQRGGPGPSFAVYPADVADEELPDGLVIRKRHVSVLISWPPAGGQATGIHLHP